jgi:integrase
MAAETKIIFNKTRLEHLLPPASGRTCYHDAKTPGLVLRITAADARAFYLYRWYQGRPVKIRLGAFPAMTVEQARNEAVKLLGQMASGNDPQAEQQARRHALTLGQLWESWLAYAKEHKRSWKDDLWMYERFLKPWAGRRLTAIARPLVQRLHTEIGDRNGKTQANRVLFLLSAMFNMARKDLDFAGDNPTAGIRRFAEQSRDRFLSGEELTAFFLALQKMPEVWQVFFLIALLTGARRGNVQAMRWSDVDLTLGLWRIPAEQAKAKKVVVVALSSQAGAILTTHRERSADLATCPWVFPSHGKTGHLVEPKGAWKRLCIAAGLADCRPHDLRRTLGSWQAISGASLPIIGASLGHNELRSTEVYSRLTLEPVRQSVQVAADRMLTFQRPPAGG